MYSNLYKRKTKREVEIRLVNSSYMVCYLNRKRCGKIAAAQFYIKDHSLEEVKEWVKKQENLTLIEK